MFMLTRHFCRSRDKMLWLKHDLSKLNVSVKSNTVECNFDLSKETFVEWNFDLSNEIFALSNSTLTIFEDNCEFDNASRLPISTIQEGFDFENSSRLQLQKCNSEVCCRTRIRPVCFFLTLYIWDFDIWLVWKRCWFP